jgi:hypothetical protein
MQSAIRQNHICGSLRKGMTLDPNAGAGVAKMGIGNYNHRRVGMIKWLMISS